MSKKYEHSLIPHGDKTVLRICGEKWPRLMSVRVAAAYTSQTSPENFKKIPEFAALIKERFGRESVDRHELDILLDYFLSPEIIQQSKTEKLIQL